MGWSLKKIGKGISKAFKKATKVNIGQVVGVAAPLVAGIVTGGVSLGVGALVSAGKGALMKGLSGIFGGAPVPAEEQAAASQADLAGTSLQAYSPGGGKSMMLPLAVVGAIILMRK